MDDQVANLVKRGFSAIALTSQTSRSTRQTHERLMEQGKPPAKLVYVSPELFCQQHFLSKLQKLVQNSSLTRVVIDEAHCAVEWGLNFRAEYSQLGQLRKCLPNVPFTAVTGTASSYMEQEMKQTLQLDKEVVVLRGRTNRPNTHYSVRYIDEASEKLDNIVGFLKQYRDQITKSGHSVSSQPIYGSGLIYCRTRLSTVNLALELTARGFSAKAYHAGLPQQQRAQIMDEWLEGDPECSIVVATIAFGMGIDKPNVRFVIHFELPNNIEEYIQQSGRAGRDNKACLCILYYSSSDSYQSLRLAQKTKDERSIMSTQALLRFAENITRCRHLSLASYFDLNVPTLPSKEWCDYACDVCKDPAKTEKLYKRWKN